MFNDIHKTTALNFARTLTKRDYTAAYSMCSKHLQSGLSEKELQEEFEKVVPPNWSDIKPVALEDNADFPFVYVVLNGGRHSEAIVIDSFKTEGDQIKIDEFEFGRP